mmetsp:Transcript_46381/g.122528  ORF Transcript_46381/g.122528 Transcript_46381/m.122528 type:complete len:415 (+) Transcript_46381:618-1862(+)
MVVLLLLRALGLELLVLPQRRLPAHLELLHALLVGLLRALELGLHLPEALLDVRLLRAAGLQRLSEISELVVGGAAAVLGGRGGGRRLPELRDVVAVALDVAQEPAQHLVALVAPPLLGAPLLEALLLLADLGRQVLDLDLDALGALRHLILQSVDLLADVGGPLRALREPPARRVPAALGVLDDPVGRLPLLRQLVDLALRLLALVLGRPHGLQLRAVPLLRRGELLLGLAGLLDELQAGAVHGMQVLLHPRDNDDLRLLVAAEVDDAAEDRAEPLWAGLPDVLDVKVVDHVDHRQLLREFEDRDHVQRLVVDLGVLHAADRLRLHLRGLQVERKFREVLIDAHGLLAGGLVDGLCRDGRVHADHGQHVRDVLRRQDLEGEALRHGHGRAGGAAPKAAGWAGDAPRKGASRAT